MRRPQATTTKLAHETSPAVASLTNRDKALRAQRTVAEWNHTQHKTLDEGQTGRAAIEKDRHPEE